MLFLIGFMGSGKSFWGRRLADERDMEFVDLDQWIAEREGSSIVQLFKDKGETAFRELERDYLREVTQSKYPRVVATGGGAPCFFDNMDWMNAHGQTIWLNVPAPVLVARLLPERAERPLLANVQPAELESFIKEKLQLRVPFYSKAKHIIPWISNEEKYLNLLKSI
jgi:shikimate kinase